LNAVEWTLCVLFVKVKLAVNARGGVDVLVTGGGEWGEQEARAERKRGRSPSVFYKSK
jgi:hypothetical protein